MDPRRLGDARDPRQGGPKLLAKGLLAPLVLYQHSHVDLALPARQFLDFLHAVHDRGPDAKRRRRRNVLDPLTRLGVQDAGSRHMPEGVVDFFGRRTVEADTTVELRHPSHQRRVVVTLDGVEGLDEGEVRGPKPELSLEREPTDDKIGRRQWIL